MDEGYTFHRVSMTGVENLLFRAGAESGKIYKEWMNCVSYQEHPFSLIK